MQKETFQKKHFHLLQYFLINTNVFHRLATVSHALSFTFYPQASESSEPHISEHHESLQVNEVTEERLALVLVINSPAITLLHIYMEQSDTMWYHEKYDS